MKSGALNDVQLRIGETFLFFTFKGKDKVKEGGARNDVQLRII